MKPIRVLHVFGGLDAGGAESRTMDIYRKIDKDKVQFDFLIHTDKKGFFEDEIRRMGGLIYRVPQFRLKNIIRYPRSLKNFFQSHPEYKIIHGHMLSTAFIYFGISKKIGIPVRIAHSRSGRLVNKDIITKIKIMTNRLSPIFATDKLAVSKEAAYAAFGREKTDSGDIKIIPNAIEAEKYTFDTNIRQMMRKRMSLKENLVVGHIGRFTPAKNHLFLLDVFYEIQKENPNSILLLIGDGPTKRHVEGKVANLGLEKKVVFLGFREDVNVFLQVMDVLLFPSTLEGLPGVVLEAQAAGLPCVISNSITDEVKITDLVTYLSLEDSILRWSREVINANEIIQRRNTYREIVAAGYDIDEIAKWYETFYIKSLRGMY